MNTTKGFMNIEKNELPYFVAEVNSSHNGNVDKAKLMIDKACEIGCNAVKFQSWSAESLYASNYYTENPIAKRMIQKFALEEAELKDLARYCEKKKIDFSSTPYSRREVDFLVDECGARFIKIASMDINNLPFIQYIAKKKIPVILSTGMSAIDEIDLAVKTILDAGNNELCVLHCVSRYPVELEQSNLNNIKLLMDRYACCVGYSDHTIGSEAAVASTVMGVGVIEKHFTLDNSVIGWDNQMATEPKEFEDMIKQCRRMKVAMGSYSRVVSKEEEEMRRKMRRSIVAKKNLQAGEMLELDMLDAKRPEGGISIGDYSQILGKRLKRDIAENEMIFTQDIE